MMTRYAVDANPGIQGMDHIHVLDNDVQHRLLRVHFHAVQHVPCDVDLLQLHHDNRRPGYGYQVGHCDLRGSAGG